MCSGRIRKAPRLLAGPGECSRRGALGTGCIWPGCRTETGFLQTLRRPSAGAPGGAGPNRVLAVCSLLMNSWLLVGNFRDMCLLGGVRFSSVGSPPRFLVCYSKGLFMTTEYLTLWEICSFCFCFCPHRMFLSAPCEGTGNYRAIHLHPHNFRQIL